MDIVGEGSVTKHKNRSLADNFLKICMELGKVMRFSKTTGYKLTRPLVARSCKIQNGRQKG